MVRREARLPARIALAAAVLGALAVSVPAAAGTPLEDAKELANTATVQYKLGAFSNALEGYTAAYEKYPTPGLLFNIGQCHKMLKHYEQAIHSFRTFLHDKPNAANREDVEALVAESEHALAAERAAPALPKPPDSTQLAPPPPPPPPAPLTPPPVEATHGSPALRVAGVAVGVAGAALLGTGVYFGLHAGSDSSAIAAARRAEARGRRRIRRRTTTARGRPARRRRSTSWAAWRSPRAACSRSSVAEDGPRAGRDAGGHGGPDGWDGRRARRVLGLHPERGRAQGHALASVSHVLPAWHDLPPPHACVPVHATQQCPTAPCTRSHPCRTGFRRRSCCSSPPRT